MSKILVNMKRVSSQNRHKQCSLIKVVFVLLLKECFGLIYLEGRGEKKRKKMGQPTSPSQKRKQKIPLFLILVESIR